MSPAPEPLSRHVLMVAPTSFFADYGCHVRILEEVRTLRRLGQRVTITTYRNGNDVDGLDIRRTLPIPWRRDYEVGSSRHKLAFDVLLGATSLRAALALRPDIVHGHLHEGALIGAAVAKLIRRPLVFDFQGSLSAEMVDHGFLRPDGRWAVAVRRLERWIDGLADAVVTSSPQAAQELVSRWGVEQGRAVALPDGVDGGAFRPGLLSDAQRRMWLRRLGVPEGRQVVAYLGLLARHQGTDLLLRIARRVVDRRPDTHFLIMGFPGTETYQAKARALRLDGHVTFTGRIPYAEAPRMLSLGDVAVAPKLGLTEGSGKILTYMAMGLPIVAFRTPVHRDFVGDAAQLVTLGDGHAFSAALVQLLEDPAARQAAGQRLRQRALERFDWRHTGRRLLEIYDRVSGRPVRGAPDESGGRTMTPPIRDAASDMLRRDGLR